MKKSMYFVLPAILCMIAGTRMSAQCEPDAAGCIDIDEPGQICPSQLPDAEVNVAYSQVITVIAPDQAEVEGNIIFVKYLQIDSISNLPDGLNYFPGTDKFWADSAECVSISGTPTEAGEFKLAIYVTPWILFGDAVIPHKQVKNDTSVVITVQGSSNLEADISARFRVMPPFPNPFTESIHLAFYTPVAELVELNVFNILGKNVYSEGIISPPGENKFSFDGRNLAPGTYFYKIIFDSGIYPGKFIKAKK